MAQMINKKRFLIIVLFLFVFLVIAGSVFLLLKSKFSAQKSDQEALALIGGSDLVIHHLRVCHLENPVGIDEEIPVFGWQMQGEERGLAQSAYRIMVADSKEALQQEDYVWDSGKINGSESVGISYAGDGLAPGSRYYWQVTVWNQDNEPFTSTEEAFFETGLMGGGMQNAKWISVPEGEKAADYSEEDLVYSIYYDIDVINTAVSFIFGAEKGRYGDMYLCQITNHDEQASFCLRKMSGGGFADLPKDAGPGEVDITTCRSGNAASFAVYLQIDHEDLSVTINDTAIGNYRIDAAPAAAVGYYMNRETSYAYLDNLFVQDASGNVIYQEDFEEEETIFAPCYAVVEEGRLKIGSGLLLTPYYENPAPLFYREFSLEDKEIESARIYMTALGSFSLVCNGQPVSEDYFAPGKLVYNQELTYMTYDVTHLLCQGERNALGITLLHGWYDRAVGYPEIWNPWGNKIALLGMLEIHYQDGAMEVITTDETFLCSLDGPVREDDIYQGEFYDATREQENFGKAGFACDTWQPAETDAVDDAYDSLPLSGKENEPIRCERELAPLSVSEPKENVFVYDFGQNFAGTCRIYVTGERGQILTLRYGETLNTEKLSNCDDMPGCIWTENLLTADATDYYVLKGAPEGESFEAEFTYHGFRYLQITGLDEPLPLEDVKGIVLSSDLERTGSFESSNELLNQFYENTVWSQRSNFLDNPTDCAQRDERHGWAGDAQIFSLTASYHMNTYNFYRKYLNDLRLLQTEAGSFPDMAPRSFGTEWDGLEDGAANNCWGDAAVVITWNLYTQYGDKTILEENYDALCKWIEVLVNTSDDYIRNWGGYGDHLSSENTPKDVSDTAWCAHSADLISRMAAILDRQEDAAYYQQIYNRYKTAWQDAYVQADGITACDTQTSYALGLAFDLFPEELKGEPVSRLNLLAEYSGYHMNAGYSGIGYLLPALSESGLTDTAYAFLLQEEFPSLLYLVKNGATTTYESLSVYTEQEDGAYFLSGSMNHYAYGAPAGWLYTNVLGIKSDEKDAGYHHILLEPEVDSHLTYARGSYESAYGRIEMAWEQTDQGYTFDIMIPANTTATLTLPSPGDGRTYLESGQSIKTSRGTEYSDDEGVEGKVKLELASGRYFFTAE